MREDWLTKIPDDLMRKIVVMAETEQVRELDDFPLYAVVIDGRVYSVQPHATSIHLPKTPRLLKPKLWSGGWEYNLTRRDGKPVSLSAARLLLMAFVELPPTPAANACYRDGNPQNLALDNLCWLSVLGRQMLALERNGGVGWTKGEQVAVGKNSQADVLEIRRLFAEGATIQALSERFRISYRNTARIIHGDYWKHLPMPARRVGYVRGEDVRTARLSAGDIPEIRSRLEQGDTLVAIAADYGVSFSTIWSIKVGKTWKHVR